MRQAMDDGVGKRIDELLAQVEREEDVTVLYACESGSRAWGFESRDSDYDVRFFYVHPPSWYLSISPGRDVVERDEDGKLDAAGWDLPKTLGLLRKSNPPLLEWLQSPIVYRQHRGCVERIRRLVPECYSPQSCYHHYLHMAQGNYREYLKGGTVWLKKYFYVLRPVLGCLWIERGLGVVPIEFGKLVERLVVDRELLDAINDLVERKKAGEELDKGLRVPIVSEFLDREIARLSTEDAAPARRVPDKVFDQVFLDCLTEVYGNAIRRH